MRTTTDRAPADRTTDAAAASGAPGPVDTVDTDKLADQWIYDVFAKRCPSRPALEHITGRWGTLVILGLREGPTRFNELRRRVDGVSEKMLSQTLHALERDGFVERTVHSTIPPRVEYSLSPLGRETTDKLHELVQLLESSMPTILASQESYDARDGD